MPTAELIALRHDCLAVRIPSGRQESLAAGTRVRVTQTRGSSYTIATETGAMYRLDARDADALGLASNEAEGFSGGETFREEMVWEQLKTVYDPEIPVSIVDLGLIYSVAVTPLATEGKRIDIKMSMTAPGCGMSEALKADVEQKLSRLPQVREVHVDVVFDPPWHQGMMSDAAKLQLGLDSDHGAPQSSDIPFKIVRTRS